ncbi:MAG TPA: hypothetical protein VHW44_26875 [Pseudonocardiaceae bacterium]|jgi:hypothetical protein|nr:hypothetical protein [Pseudonocardiaceae bacterium]
MAELVVDGSDLVLKLSTAEKMEGLHGDLRVPRSSVRRVEVLDDAHRAAGITKGIKVGTRLPGVIEVGTILGEGKRFAAVHHDTPRGVRVVLADASFDEWIVGCADPESVAASIAPE